MGRQGADRQDWLIVSHASCIATAGMTGQGGNGAAGGHVAGDVGGLLLALAQALDGRSGQRNR